MPVLRSGSFVLYGFQLVDHGALLDGDTQYSPSSVPGQWSWQNFGTIFIIPFPTDVVFFGPTFLDTSTEGDGWTAGAPPPGFNLRVGDGTFGGPVLHTILTNCAGFGLLGTVEGIGLSGLCGNTVYANSDPLLLYIELLTFHKWHLTNTVGLTSGGVNKVGPWSIGNPTPAGIYVTGGYDIIAWWWTRPDKDECGNDQLSHNILAEEEPEGGYSKLDPDDYDAHPTPVITSVEPNHGFVAGGTAIAIIGTGFGDDATVTVGGSPATDVEVVSQYRIECVTPAHVAGDVTVVVTNPDGVSS